MSVAEVGRLARPREDWLRGVQADAAALRGCLRDVVAAGDAEAGGLEHVAEAVGEASEGEGSGRVVSGVARDHASARGRAAGAGDGGVAAAEETLRAVLV